MTKPTVGEVWKDEDGYRWKVVHVDSRWAWCKPGYGRHAKDATAVQTNLAWFKVWTRA